ncbi:MAG: DegV family EDD domain-containing protein [Gemmatimonadetes bacterium]|uniref:DegV family EDD domain-containing protein n=1 Tax=Candidatus Kutchimonas denitrificans TaxID=3056748 RepID=A0AAE4ZCA8_9BACT|nr:DegV family EDD domain-containing protein [Gemmatimonadota bacterium]NIR74995.1 DegV family EDD domain-containing protein [Candidatus Kutchimonas denitrificans]NIS01578.1 DegV family EDD domain-containing protein [Gemmatimonadota bacterium]NIT67316.1 DegV family EDD domain-containing protein [Gemmatimonadota bacterium]NIU52679.1 DegV family EDD domain-containing protein [Gemmatimonadota bacterium]
MLFHRDELDRLNVFPVPDGDTGTNLALTFRGMVEAVDGHDDGSVADLASRLAEAGVLAARGNSGMMMSHFFLGFAEGLGGSQRAGSDELAEALVRASSSLYQAVDEPREGTILTVVRESTEELHRRSAEISDLERLAQDMLGAARTSLARTPELLPPLREANVVDAGAQGFVHFLEGVVSLIDRGRERMPVVVGVTPVRDAAAETAFPDDGGRGFRYCTEFVVRGEPLPERRQLAEAVRGSGGSLIVTRAPTLAKIHIHTDDPVVVEELLAELGGTVERVKTEDMQGQHRARQRKVKSRMALVTDTTCDLPPELIIEHDITIVPLTVMFGDEAFLDQVDLGPEEFLARLTDPDAPQPTTSQPAPAHLEQAFGRAAEHAEEVLGIFLSGRLSGTLGQAQSVAGRFEDARVTVYDSRSSSLGLGMKVLRAAELAAAGKTGAEIVADLEGIAGRSGLLLTVDTLKYLMRSGRLGKARGFLGSMLQLKPLLSLDEDGAVIPVDRVIGREAAIPRVLELLRERFPAERGRLRMGVAHVACHELAQEVGRRLEAEFAPDEVLIRPAAGVISAHTGPGAWAVFYQCE